MSPVLRHDNLHVKLSEYEKKMRHWNKNMERKEENGANLNGESYKTKRWIAHSCLQKCLSKFSAYIIHIHAIFGTVENKVKIAKWIVSVSLFFFSVARYFT